MAILRAGLLLPSLAALLLGGTLAATARAQLGGPEVDLNLLALQWTRGSWRAPLVCTIDGSARRGLRRVLVSPGPRHARPPTFRIQLFDLEIPAGTRCTDEAGRPQPNAEGTLYFHLLATSRPDIAQHDFQTLLRREGGFEFRIRRGRLRLADDLLDTPGPNRRIVDFGGGTARFALVKRGTDARRRLADFSDRRLMTLALESADGVRLDLDLVYWDLR